MMFIKKIFSFLYEEISQLIFTIIQSYPDGSIGYRLRNYYWIKNLKSCGCNSEFRKHSAIGGPKQIVIGNFFLLGHGAMITANHSEGIFIGNYVQMARGTFVHATNHKTDNIDIPIMQQGVSSAKINFNDRLYSIVIEDDVWIGSNTIILSGTHLKKGCVVSAGSVISGTYESYSVIGGNPGRVIKKRN